MKHFSFYLTVLGLGLATVFSCTNPIDTGSSLLDEDLVNVQNVDTFKITTTALEGDSLLVYTIPTSTSSGFNSRYFLGKMDDPIMGLTEVALQSQIVPVVQFHPGLDITVDSMVLVLPYSLDNVYGDKAQRYDLEIRELADSFALDKNYYGNQKLAVKPTVLQAKSFAVNFDSVKINDFTTGIAVETKVPAQLRIRFNDPALQNKLLGIDTSVYRSRVKFIQSIFGLQLSTSNIGKALAAFDLTSSRAGIYLYYKTASGSPEEYRYVFGFVAANALNRDRGTSLLGKYLAGEPDQEYILLQGQEGANSKFSIPSIKNLKNVIINKAELVLRVASIPGDEPIFFTPSPRILAMYRNSNGRLSVVEDFAIASQSGSLDPFYGSAYVSGQNNEPGTYTINLSAHVQNIVKGKVPTDIYLKSFPLAESAARTTLYRADHPLYGAKLRVYYTQLGQ